MKSIEKLRRVAEEQSSTTTHKLVREALVAAIDEIEQEIKERYVELPVDSNGVPIKDGDILTDGEHTLVVGYIEFQDGRCTIYDENCVAQDCCNVEHVPDPATKLKSCPFCGSKDLYIVENMIGRNTPFISADDKTVGIFCNTCKQTVTLEVNEDEGRNLTTEQRAVEAWNKRVG